MDLKVTVDGNINGDCTRGKRDGIGKGEQRNVAFKLAPESDNFRVNQIHHSWMKGQIEHMNICKGLD